MQLALCLYDAYHYVCLQAQAADMAHAGIPQMFECRKSWHWSCLVDRVCFPVVGVLYGALPALFAQM